MGKASNGLALTAATILIEILVVIACLNLGALASAGRVVLPEVLSCATAFINALTLAGMFVPERNWRDAVVAAGLVLGNREDEGSRSVGAAVLDSDDQFVNSTLEVFQCKSEDCTPILAFVYITSIESSSEAIISSNNQHGIAGTVGIEFGVEGGLVSLTPGSSAILVDPMSTTASDEVRMVLFIVFFKDCVIVFGGDDFRVVRGGVEESCIGEC
jgi:hypothetical protein